MQHIPRGSVDSWEDFDIGGANPSGSAEPQPESVLNDSEVIVNTSNSRNLQDVSVINPPTISCYSKSLNILRALWGTVYTEDTNNIQETIVKLTLRELIVYLFFLILVCLVGFGMTSVNAFYFFEATSTTFLDTRWDQYDDHSTFRHIDKVDQWYQYALGPLMNGLYMKSEDQNNSLLHDIQLVGTPRLRLLRVRNNSCNVNTDFVEFIDTCYAEYSSSAEDKNPFGPMNSSAWFYNSAEEISYGASYRGEMATYNPGGYIQDLSLNMSLSIDTITSLKNNQWIDGRATRAVFIEFSQYNININLFCIVKLMCEFSASGGIISESDIKIVQLIRYFTSWGYFILSCEVALILFIIYYIIEEFLEIRKHRLSYLKSLWSWLDLLIIALFICTASFNAKRQTVASKTLTNIMSSNSGFVNTDDVGLWFEIFESSVALLVFFTWTKIFKFISFNRSMKQLTQTMAFCSFDIFCFSVFFLLVFLAFAQLANLLFGSYLFSFSTITRSIYSQFYILLGNYDYNELVATKFALGPAYFITMVFVLFFILLNMFFAIISDAYGEVKVELSKNNKDFEMVDYFKKGYRTMVNKLLFRRQRQTVSTNISSNGSSSTRRQIYNIDINEPADTTRNKAIQNQGDSSDSDSSVLRPPTRLRSHVTGVSRQGRRNRGQQRAGVSEDDFSMLKRRVDRMEHSIGSVVSKMDAVLVKLEAMEDARKKRRDAVARMVDGFAQPEMLSSEDGKQMYMERLVRDELEKWDSMSFISGAGTSSEASHTTSQQHSQLSTTSHQEHQQCD